MNHTCHCGDLAIEKSVTRPGNNYGRPFVTCRNRACRFFKWLDVETDEPKKTEDTGEKCQCGKAVKSGVATTEANKGRPYTTCPERACGYFQWKDDLGKKRKADGTYPEKPPSPVKTPRREDAVAGRDLVNILANVTSQNMELSITLKNLVKKLGREGEIDTPPTENDN